jgi:1,4-alpha-glucan branching enzyme
MENSGDKAVGAILHDKGVTFRVWAPFAQNVFVSGSFNNWAKSPMDKEDGGYWHVEALNAQAGQEYKFVIDTGNGELRKNDPRSLQMTTSAGNSVIINQSFDWANDNFKAPSFNEQVVYELHVGTFNRPDPAVSGTF